MTVRKYIDTLEQLMTHPKLGASWERFALDTLCRSLDKREDELYFFATHTASELDLFCQGSGRNWGAEFKYSDAPRLTKSMKTVIEALCLSHLWVVYPSDRSYRLDDYVDHHALTPVLPPKWQENMMNAFFRQYVENKFLSLLQKDRPMRPA